MAKVLGIGGLFFRSKNPSKLAAWYEKHLGINPVPTSYDTPAWQQEAGDTVFAPFPEDTEMFNDRAKQWMINFRVDDLDAMIADLRDADIAVDVDLTTYPNGRFAQLADPEGNPIQLWQV